MGKVFLLRERGDKKVWEEKSHIFIESGPSFGVASSATAQDPTPTWATLWQGQICYELQLSVWNVWLGFPNLGSPFMWSGASGCTTVKKLLC